MKGVVVCPEPRAAEEGSKVLAKGGNAVDAAVATAFMQCVVGPHESSIAGLGTMLIYAAKTREKVVIDFHALCGSKATPDMWQDKIIKISVDTALLQNNENMVGYKAICTPGTIRGLHEALTKYGTMSWGEVLRPAIRYAEEGFRVNSEIAGVYTASGLGPGFPSGEEVLKYTAESIKIWYKEDGSRYKVGDLMVNKDLANTLKRLVEEGAEAFYTGPIAKEIAEDIERNGGFITSDDLKDYKVRTYSPLAGTYRGYDVFTNRPPNGGVIVLEVLNILEGYPLNEMRPDSFEYVWLMAQALRCVHSDRVQYLGDEEFVDVPVDMLISKERGEYWRKKIDAGERIVVPKEQMRQPSHTTHISVLDEAGNAVSLTHSRATNPGCGTPGLGFIYNGSMWQFNAMPGLLNSIAPRKARESGLAPTMVFEDGKLFMVIGSPVGFEAATANARGIVNVIDHGMSMLEAVNAPRIRCQGGLIELEGRHRADVAEELRRRGNPVHHWADGYVYPRNGSMHGIRIDPVTGKWDAAADPRQDGGVAFSYV